QEPVLAIRILVVDSEFVGADFVEERKAGGGVECHDEFPAVALVRSQPDDILYALGVWVEMPQFLERTACLSIEDAALANGGLQCEGSDYNGVAEVVERRLEAHRLTDEVGALVACQRKGHPIP